MWLWLIYDWCDVIKKLRLAAYSARVAFEAKSASAIFLGSESTVQERCAASKKSGNSCSAWAGHLVTWSCLMSRWVSWPTPWCIWHLPKNGNEGHDTMERKSSLCLAEPIFDYLVVFQFQSGSNLRRLPRNIQVGLVGLCAFSDKCFHHENHSFEWLKYISWLRMLRLQFDDLDYMTGDDERPRDFRPRKPLWRPQLVQRRQGLTVRKNDTAACDATDVVCKIIKKTHFSGDEDRWCGWNDWSDENTVKKSKDIAYKPCNDQNKTCLLAKAPQLDWPVKEQRLYLKFKPPGASRSLF